MHHRLIWIERADLAQSAVIRMLRDEEGRYVHARNATQGPEQVHPVSLVPGEVNIADVEDGLFAVTEQKRIDEVSNRLRVEGARSAGDHQWMRCVALVRQQRNAT